MGTSRSNLWTNSVNEPLIPAGWAGKLPEFVTKLFKLFLFVAMGGIRLVIVWGGASHAPCRIHHTAYRLSQLLRHQDGRTGARPGNQDGRQRPLFLVWSCRPMSCGLQYQIQVSSCKLKHMKMYCKL
jgi:hypothetical protein